MLIDRLKENNPNLVISKLKSPLSKGDLEGFSPSDQDILSKLNKIITSTNKNIENYRFGQASEDLYQFFWHEFCDVYIEDAKNRGEETIPVLLTVLETSLKLLHPFIPFITETVYQNLQEKFNFKKELLISSSWPKDEN
jgi:valyl-tRNA synthetase